MSPTTAFPVKNVPTSVPWAISSSRTENRCGGTAAPTAWLASAAAPRKRSNMERTAGACRAISARNRPSKTGGPRPGSSGPRRALALYGHKSPPPSGRVLHIKKQRAGRRGRLCSLFLSVPMRRGDAFSHGAASVPPRVRRSARCPAPCGSFLWYRRPRAAFCPP